MPQKTARKQPQQARSRATVTAILEAMIRILDREGSEAATTTRIAEVAGISIGTLYQYFSDRDQILDALQDRELERAMELMQRLLASGAKGSARELAREVIQGMLDLYALAPGLHRVLVVEGLRVTPTYRVQAFDMQVISMVRAFLVASKWPLRRANVEAAAFVIFQAVRAALLARLFESPSGLDDETLTEELTELVLCYLVDESAEARDRLKKPRRVPVRGGTT
jgi:AcrR family transcriptional regulator